MQIHRLFRRGAALALGAGLTLSLLCEMCIRDRGMLTQMPADIVKIDRLFISLINDQTHEFNRAFIAAVIQLCHSVGISVCVEGVEQLDELKTVQTLNADSVQGYYVSRPITREAFEEKYWPGAEG